jgi:hypothetical protein
MSRYESESVILVSSLTLQMLINVTFSSHIASVLAYVCMYEFISVYMYVCINACMCAPIL